MCILSLNMCAYIIVHTHIYLCMCRNYMLFTDIYLPKAAPHPVSRPWTKALQQQLVRYFGSQHEENELSLVSWQVTGYMDRLVHQDEAMKFYVHWDYWDGITKIGRCCFFTCLCNFHDIMGLGKWDHMRQQPSNFTVNFRRFFGRITLTKAQQNPLWCMGSKPTGLNLTPKVEELESYKRAVETKPTSDIPF